MIRVLGKEAEFVAADVFKTIEVQSLIDKTIQRYGCLDFAFNNAGIEGVMVTTDKCTEENWDHTLAINLKGIWLCMKYELQHMLAHCTGSIVNCSSIAAW